MDDVRQRLRLKLENLLGAEEASWLMDRPPGGWTDLVTNQTLDVKLHALRQELRAELAATREQVGRLDASVDRRLRAKTCIMTTTLITGLALAFAAGRIG